MILTILMLIILISTILMLIILISTILMLIILILTISSARLLAATTLRNVLGTLNLGDILSQREIIAKEMQVENTNPTPATISFVFVQDTLVEGTAAWGVQVERVEVKEM